MAISDTDGRWTCYHAGMDGNPKKRGGAWVAILLAMLFAAYPLSLGPAVALIGATGTHRDPFWFTIFQCIYGPLALVPRPFGDPIEWWIEIWDFYGEFH